MSLKEYAEYMFTAYAGISLMISPHPSYPPLEMSTFGVRTITNKFENKDLSSFNSNIISLDCCLPETIANTLIDICNEYVSYKSEIVLNEEYLEGEDLSRTSVSIKESIERMIENEVII